MGDYLQRGLLAEPYLHFFDIEFSTRFEETVAPFVREQAQEYASAIFRLSFDVSVEMGPGGTKVWIRILTNVVKAFIIYGGLRQAADYLVHDGRRFCEHVAAPVIYKVESIGHSAYRFERRLGIPGLVKRIIESLDSLPSICQHASPAERRQHFGYVWRRTERLFALLEPEAEEIVATGLESIVLEIQPILPPDQKELEEFLRRLRSRKRK